jgi:hypothetical protein
MLYPPAQYPPAGPPKPPPGPPPLSPTAALTLVPPAGLRIVPPAAAAMALFPPHAPSQSAAPPVPSRALRLSVPVQSKAQAPVPRAAPVPNEAPSIGTNEIEWGGLGWAEQEWCCEVGGRAAGRYAGMGAVRWGWVRWRRWGGERMAAMSEGGEHRGGLSSAGLG